MRKIPVMLLMAALLLSASLLSGADDTPHTHDYRAIEPGRAQCMGDGTCSARVTDAPTVMADPTLRPGSVSKGDKIRVPVLVNNAEYIGLTLGYETSGNIALSSIDVTGTPFEGGIAEFADVIVLSAAKRSSNITEDGTVLTLVFTAKRDIPESDGFFVKIDVIEAVDLGGADVDFVHGTEVNYALRSWLRVGDADGDGQITIMDAVHIFNYANGYSSSAEYTFAAGDVDGDGDVTTMDAAYVKNYLSGLPIPTDRIGELID